MVAALAAGGEKKRSALLGGYPHIWNYGRRVSAKGFSKGTSDLESGPKLLTLFKAGPYSESFDASQAGPASWKI
jgi:hypothetical protein